MYPKLGWTGLIRLICEKVDPRLVGLPTVPFNITGLGVFDASKVKFIHVDPLYANSVNSEGETLIPPKLIDFAHTFAEDLLSKHHIDARVTERSRGGLDSIFLTLGDDADYLDAAGRPSAEGYALHVDHIGVTISGASPLGVWWGTRTFLQQVTLGNGRLPLGTGHDTPGWRTRGMMLDIGRHYYPPDFITELCTYMSYFKQNTFHLHLSDNLYNNLDVYTREESLALYARFRLWSDSATVDRLNKHRNESYTRQKFDSIQRSCARRGVTVIPEIEAPGHALVLTQWKPQLGLSDLSLLNVSYPDTIPTMQSIWRTFVDWFHCKTVHIGADEYTASPTDYTSFVNTMDRYITSISGKHIRIWGAFTPNVTNGYPDHGVSIQHWAAFEANPYTAFIQQNYSVVNSDDWMYCVAKYSGSYPQVLEPAKAFSIPSGGPWYPYVFDTKNSSNNPAPSDRRILGAVAALWNDYGPSTTTYLEAYYTWRRGLPAVADRQWRGDISEDEYYRIFAKLHADIPGQNLHRTVASKSSTILRYKWNGTRNATGPDLTVYDLSGNGYNAIASCPINENGTLPLNVSCHLTTPLNSEGRNYTMTIMLRISEMSEDRNTPARLLSGRDSVLYISPTVGLKSSNGWLYATDQHIPVNTWTTLVVSGRNNETYIQIGEAKEVQVTTTVNVNSETNETSPIAIEAPLERFGGDGCGFSGELNFFELLST